jgi:hypothetical protein
LITQRVAWTSGAKSGLNHEVAETRAIPRDTSARYVATVLHQLFHDPDIAPLIQATLCS